VVSMNLALPPHNTTAQSPDRGRDPIVGQMTTNESQPLTYNDSGLLSNPCPQFAPVASSKVTSSALTHTTDSAKLE